MGRPGWVLTVIGVSVAGLLVTACAKKTVPIPGATGRSGAWGEPGADGGAGDEPDGAGGGGGLAQGWESTGAGRGTRDAGGRGDSWGVVPAAAPEGSGTTFGGDARPDPQSFMETSELHDIYFDFDRYDVRPRDAERLRANAAWLKSRPQELVIIEGHCDERGTSEYNLALGEHRAKSTKNFLVSEGIDPRRITVISYGELRPVCVEPSEACWARNRRAHFMVKSR
jgi:peptidoglycan-associated lipoprotein